MIPWVKHCNISFTHKAAGFREVKSLIQRSRVSKQQNWDLAKGPVETPRVEEAWT